MEIVQSRSRKLLRASLAVNKHIAYSNAISTFNKFRIHHHMGIQWPAAVSHVVYFISSRFEKDCSPATISSLFWHQFLP